MSEMPQTLTREQQELEAAIAHEQQLEQALNDALR
jgi:hypothetical protein